MIDFGWKWHSERSSKAAKTSISSPARCMYVYSMCVVCVFEEQHARHGDTKQITPCGVEAKRDAVTLPTDTVGVRRKDRTGLNFQHSHSLRDEVFLTCGSSLPTLSRRQSQLALWAAFRPLTIFSPELQSQISGWEERIWNLTAHMSDKDATRSLDAGFTDVRFVCVCVFRMTCRSLGALGCGTIKLFFSFSAIKEKKKINKA